MNVDRNATGLRLIALLLTDVNDPITGVTWNDVDLLVEKKSPADADWMPVTLVDGTVGTHANRSWKEVGEGTYQFCPDNSWTDAGNYVAIRITYGSNRPQYDVIEYTGSVADADEIMIANTVIDAINLTLSELLGSSGTVDNTQVDFVAARQWPEAIIGADVAISEYYGDDWLIEIAVAGPIPATEDFYFTLKAGDVDTISDAEATLQLQYDHLTGNTILNYLNGVFNGSTNEATITYESYVESGVTKYRVIIYVDDSITKQIAMGTYERDLRRVGDFTDVLDRQVINVLPPVTKAST